MTAINRAPRRRGSAAQAPCRTRRWTQYGHDRIYVERDGVQLGYYDVLAATAYCEQLRYRQPIVNALRPAGIVVPKAARRADRRDVALRSCQPPQWALR